MVRECGTLILDTQKQKESKLQFMLRSKPILFYTMGYPGAGKTTLAKSLELSYGFIHVHADKLAFELLTFPKYSKEEVNLVHGVMQDRAIDYLSNGQSLVYDASVNNFILRRKLVELAKNNGALAIGLWLNTPIKIALSRASQARNSEGMVNFVRITPPHIFKIAVSNFERPLKIEREIIRVSGAEDFTDQIMSINSGLAKLHQSSFILT